MLLGPVVSQLTARRLVIVGDGALQYLPFSVLPGPKGSTAAGEPLVVRHEIISLPSASTLAVLRQQLNGRPVAANAVAILADPVFDADDVRVTRGGAPAASPQNAGERLPRLPFTRREAEGILSLARSASTMRALDFDASRDTATSQRLAQYRIVHFATHGFLDGEHPELSGIALSLVDRDGLPRNGYLRLHDLYTLDLPAELVVLSACQSALGEAVKGEGLVGLTRGFMYAGTPRIVASLWRVDDVATAELMKRFYEGILVKRLPPAAALRAAQLALQKQRRWAAPYFWAAFVLQGEWRGWRREENQ
jgi:CHAT domain-containing protein